MRLSLYCLLGLLVLWCMSQPAEAIVTATDDFEGKTVDPMWTIEKTGDTTIDQTGGVGKVTASAAGVEGNAAMNNQLVFQGDFDISVEYDWLTYEGPGKASSWFAVRDYNEPEWVSVQINWYTRLNELEQVRTISSNHQTEVGVWTQFGQGFAREDVPLSGKFRIQRIDSTVITYFWDTDHWNLIGSDDAFTGPAIVFLISGNGNSAGDSLSASAFEVNYDNFYAEAEAIVPKQFFELHEAAVQTGGEGVPGDEFPAQDGGHAPVIDNGTVAPTETDAPGVDADDCLSEPVIRNAWAFDKNFGRIGRLYPGGRGIYFTLLGGRTAMQPEAGYYLLKLDHPNYQAMVDLLYQATSDEWTIRVRTEEELNEDQFAEVMYFVIEPEDRVPLDRQTDSGEELLGRVEAELRVAGAQAAARVAEAQAALREAEAQAALREVEAQAEVDNSEVPADGIYLVWNDHPNGRVGWEGGQRVARAEGGVSLLIELLSDDFGTATLSSISGDDSYYRLDLADTGLLAGVGDDERLGICIDGVCFVGLQDRRSGVSIDMIGMIPDQRTARRVAQRLGIELEERRESAFPLAVRWIPQQEEYEPGGSVVLQLEVTNLGKEPYEFTAGGRQRGPRDNQFSFLAYGDSGRGQCVLDTGDRTHHGGPRTVIVLNPGDTFTREVDIRKWFNLQDPGSYRITCVYDLGEEFAVGDCIVRIAD